jgi:hypothetical protein
VETTAKRGEAFLQLDHPSGVLDRASVAAVSVDEASSVGLVDVVVGVEDLGEEARRGGRVARGILLRRIRGIWMTTPRACFLFKFLSGFAS